MIYFAMYFAGLGGEGGEGEEEESVSFYTYIYTEIAFFRRMNTYSS